MELNDDGNGPVSQSFDEHKDSGTMPGDVPVAAKKTTPSIPAVPQKSERVIAYENEQADMEFQYNEDSRSFSPGLRGWLFNTFFSNNVIRVNMITQRPMFVKNGSVHVNNKDARELAVKVRLFGVVIASSYIPLKDRTPITNSHITYANLERLEHKSYSVSSEGDLEIHG